MNKRSLKPLPAFGLVRAKKRSNLRFNLKRIQIRKKRMMVLIGLHCLLKKGYLCPLKNLQRNPQRDRPWEWIHPKENLQGKRLEIRSTLLMKSLLASTEMHLTCPSNLQRGWSKESVRWKSKHRDLSYLQRDSQGYPRKTKIPLLPKVMTLKKWFRRRWKSMAKTQQ